jgi:hypothetical protein
MVMSDKTTDAQMMQALIAGYVAASVMQMWPLTPPVKLEECEAGRPIKIRLASGMLATITVEVA